MSRDAIESRQQHVRRILEREPDLPTNAVRERTRASSDVVRRIRAEVKALRCLMT
jgi:hypothetical protein